MRHFIDWLFFFLALNWAFFIIPLGLWIFKKKITEVKLPSHVSHQRVHDINMTYYCWWETWSLGYDGSCMISSLEVILSPFPHYKYKLITELSPPLEEGWSLLRPTSWREEYCDMQSISFKDVPFLVPRTCEYAFFWLSSRFSLCLCFQQFEDNILTCAFCIYPSWLYLSFLDL